MERLIEYFKPDNYQLDLTISRQDDYIRGQVIISGQIKQDIVKFHAVNLDIKSVSYVDQECTFNYNNEILEISTAQFTKQAAVDTFKIIFETKLNRNMQGCYLSSYQYDNKKQLIAATQFESHYARECFPCIDEPGAKAVFNLSIFVPDFTSDDVVLANTECLETRTENNISQYIFAPTPRMSTYLLAWVIGPLKSVSAVNDHGVKVTSYCALNQSTTSLEFANEVACRSLDYYDKRFGIKYPLAKLDQVALPDFEAGAMENWGLVTYRESCMLSEPDASIDTKQSVATTVTHELSHQWFGDLVTMEWWDDLWLNESFATIMEYYATDALYPELKIWQEFFTGDCVAALRRDSLPGVQSVQQAVHHPAEIATLFDGAIVYAKGARLVLMLMRLMGDENFFRGVHEYFDLYQYQNTVGDDLWICLQKHADFNIKDFMHSWISQPGYPALQRDGDSWQQKRFLINGTTDDTQWPLPEIKDDMSGHYLINLDAETFSQRLDDYDSLNDEQKLRLLIDRMLLTKAREVSADSLLDILPKFVNEDAPVWDILLSIINELKVFFPDDSDAENIYRQFLRNTIHDRIRAVGVTSRPHDDNNIKRLRKILAVVARFARDQEIIDQLADLYNNDLSRIDSEMRGNILMAKMMRDESEVFSPLLDKYQTEPDPDLKDDLLCALATAKLPENIATCINLLSQPEIVRPQDHLYLYIYLLRNPKSRAQALTWLYDNWNYVEKLTGEKSIEDYPRCMTGYIDTRAEADRFYNFFDRMKDSPILKRTLIMSRTSIESKLTLVAEESASVQAKLAKLMEK